MLENVKSFIEDLIADKVIGVNIDEAIECLKIISDAEQKLHYIQKEQAKLACKWFDDKDIAISSDKINHRASVTTCFCCGEEVVIDKAENCSNCGTWLGDEIEEKNRNLFMETVLDSQFYFGLHSDNQNLSTFVLRKNVSVKDMSKEKNSFDFDIIYGRDILEEDRDEVKKISIDLITSDGDKEFHSISGSTFRVVKLTKEEMLNFLR